MGRHLIGYEANLLAYSERRLNEMNSVSLSTRTPTRRGPWTLKPKALHIWLRNFPRVLLTNCVDPIGLDYTKRCHSYRRGTLLLLQEHYTVQIDTLVLAGKESWYIWEHLNLKKAAAVSLYSCTSHY